MFWESYPSGSPPTQPCLWPHDVKRATFVLSVLCLHYPRPSDSSASLAYHSSWPASCLCNFLLLQTWTPARHEDPRCCSSRAGPHGNPAPSLLLPETCSGSWVPHSLALSQIHTLHPSPRWPFMDQLSHGACGKTSSLMCLFLWEKCTAGSKRHYKWQLGPQASPQKPIKYIMGPEKERTERRVS